MKSSCLLRKKQLIVFDGDSLTNQRAGPCLDTWPLLHLMNWHESWADKLAQLLFCWRPDLDLQFHNAAVSGSTCRDLTARMEQFVVPLRPDWVFITLAGNDASQRIPLDEFRQQMGAYCRRIAETSGGRVLFVGGMRPAAGAAPDRMADQPLRRLYYQALRAVARRHHGVYLDVGARLASKAAALHRQNPLHTIYSDGSHYNALGALLLAGEVLRALRVEI